MLRRFSVNFAIFSMLLDAASVAFCVWAAGAVRPHLNNLDFIKNVRTNLSVPASLYGLFPLIWVFIFAALSVYDGRKFLRASDELAALFIANFIASVSSAGVLYFSYREVSRALFVTFVISTFFLCLLWRVLIRGYFRARSATLAISRRLVIVGTGPLGKSVGKQINAAISDDLTLIGYVSDGFEGPSISNLLGDVENLASLITVHEATDVVIALPYSEYHKMSKIVLMLETKPVGVWIALGFFDLALYRTGIEDFAGLPMLDLRASAINDYQRIVKRLFDIICSAIILAPGLIFMAISALIILLDDGSPVIFRQKRLGENGRLFDILKFRTMVRDAEQLQGQVEKRDEKGNLTHKSRNDPRVTRVGRFLRRFSLDELPQIFNVLGGSMSLVGPRPEMPHLVDLYQPWQRKRFAIPPGITGWWQVNGRSDKPMHLHTEDDLYYIQNYSIWLDIQIIARTIWIVLVGRGAY